MPIDFFSSSYVKLAECYLNLSSINPSDNLFKAINVNQKVLNQTMVQKDQYWIDASFGIGIAYKKLYLNYYNWEYADSALKYFKISSKFLDNKAHMLSWCYLQLHIGDVLTQLAAEKENLKLSYVGSYEPTDYYNKINIEMIERTSGRNKLSARLSESIALYYLGVKRKRDKKYIDSVLVKYKEADIFYQKVGLLDDWMRVHLRIGIVYLMKENDSADTYNNLSEKYFRDLENIISKDKTPNRWLEYQYNYGILYRNKRTGNKKGNLEKSLKCFNNALEMELLANIPSDLNVLRWYIKDTEDKLSQY